LSIEKLREIKTGWNLRQKSHAMIIGWNLIQLVRRGNISWDPLAFV
jgi:hypothetical protein